jgi:hypothetical protein
MSRFLDYVMIVVSLVWLIPVGCVACYQLVLMARGIRRRR